MVVQEDNAVVVYAHEDTSTNESQHRVHEGRHGYKLPSFSAGSKRYRDGTEAGGILLDTTSSSLSEQRRHDIESNLRKLAHIMKDENLLP